MKSVEAIGSVGPPIYIDSGVALVSEPELPDPVVPNSPWSVFWPVFGFLVVLCAILYRMNRRGKRRRGLP